MSASPSRQLPDRNLALEIVRVTEAAALAAAPLVGMGDKEAADQAAVDGMRHRLHSAPRDALAVIRAGEARGIAAIREAGARVRLIAHGDVSAALLAVTERSPVDLLWGIGGTPEGVISAAAVKCLGGQLLGRLWPRDEEERNAALQAGY